MLINIEINLRNGEEIKMTYVHDKSKSKLPLGKVLDKGFNITSEDNKKTVANTHVN